MLDLSDVVFLQRAVEIQVKGYLIRTKRNFPAKFDNAAALRVLLRFGYEYDQARRVMEEVIDSSNPIKGAY
ncbi:MAG: hypothetical protein KW793_00685 [Candidatus Doudnabacteria bacterium]|nr:hypothetical protein [Candidatus Doudnabacteria bacterium]